MCGVLCHLLACRKQQEIFVTCNGMSLIKMLNRIGPRTDPCGIPNFTEPSEEYEPWRKTRCVLPSRYDLKNGKELELRRYHPSLYIMILWSTRSKAFFGSRNIMPDASDLFIAVSQECVSRTEAVLQECLYQKPDWKGWMSRIFFSPNNHLTAHAHAFRRVWTGQVTAILVCSQPNVSCREFLTMGSLLLS